MNLQYDFGIINVMTTTRSFEYVYTIRYSAFGRKAYSTFHRILRKTDKTIFIDNRGDYPQGWKGYGLKVIITLNRTMLETEGRAWSKSQRRYFYVLPIFVNEMIEEEIGDRLPRFVQELNLTIPFSVEDVKTAFRNKVKMVHPDYGGKVEDFIALQNIYEQALAFFDVEKG